MRYLRKHLAFTTTILASVLVAGAQEQPELAFGSSEKTNGSMLGIFYDLKQNQNRQPIPDGTSDLDTLASFLDSGWDENVLSRFFRATTPVYATEVIIPAMSAEGAPRAFGLAGTVKPSHWFVIYKAQVSPPEDGTYRFVGIADDVMAVAVNSKTVLVSHYKGWKDRSTWKEPAQAEGIPVWAGKMKRGDWFTCKKGEIIDLDILIGEVPGNLFGAWLLIERQGAVYQTFTAKEGGRYPVLPAFQVKAKNIPNPPGEQFVPFTTDGKPWTCHP